MLLLALSPLTSTAARAAEASKAQETGSNDLVILSTVDVRGSFLPCGCTIPKGGLPRRAALIDSTRALHRRLLVVDAGAVFPDKPERRSVGSFIMECMAAMNTDAVGVGDCDLTNGLEFLRSTARDAGLPLTCATLIENATGRPAFEPWRLVRAADVKVGVFGLLAQDATRGPAADSLTLTDPAPAAREAIAQLRTKGASVIVVLSQLGNEATEKLLEDVAGIDVAVSNGRLLRSNGHLTGNTFVAAGGGEHGYYVGVTNVGLDRRKHRLEAVSEAIMLGPTLRSQPEMLAKAQAFERAAKPTDGSSGAGSLSSWGFGSRFSETSRALASVS
jgi:2',3'-cyclic-nucleotide 2'-phosphodiesterase (5'-nucleotidase family)